MSIGRNDYGKFVEQYGKRNGRKGYDYVIHLTFKHDYRKSVVPRSKLREWYQNVSKKTYIDGIVNFDKDERGCVHIHGVVICNLDIDKFRMLMVRTWSGYGGFKFDAYYEKGGIDYYISKIVNDEIIEYDMLVNLI